LESTAQLAVSRGCDVDQDGKLPMPLPPIPAATDVDARKKTAPNVLRLCETKARQVEVMLESVLEAQVDGAKLEPELE
jgi:hypothetical protein